MDNRIFNVNGRGKEMLRVALALALHQADGCYGDNMDKLGKAKGWIFSETKGLILMSYLDDKKVATPFLTPLGVDALTEMVNEWLKGDQAKTVKHNHEDWDHDCDHDGSNSIGWRVYVEDWGHVDNHWGVIAAVKPAYLWHGK